VITPDQLKDYYSASGNSEGGAISTNQIPTTQLSAAASAGATSISVYDAGGFAVNDEIVIDDGTNREKRTITAISGTTFSLNVALTNSYAIGTTVAKKNNLFPDVSAAQATTGVTLYRKFFRKNTSSADTWYAVVNWIAKQFQNAAVSIGLGIDSADDADPAQGNMVAMTSSAQIALVSSGADTRVVTLKGLDTSGNPITENVTLNGTTEVLSTNTFSKLYLAYVDSLNSSNTITIKQGSGGSTLGTIGPNKKVSFLWFGKKVDASNNIVNAEGGDVASYDTGIKIGDVSTGGYFGMWVRLMVPAGASAVGNNTTFIQSRGETA
jgi:hypothetical protein